MTQTKFCQVLCNYIKMVLFTPVSNTLFSHFPLRTHWNGLCHLYSHQHSDHINLSSHTVTSQWDTFWEVCCQEIMWSWEPHIVHVHRWRWCSQSPYYKVVNLHQAKLTVARHLVNTRRMRLLPAYPTIWFCSKPFLFNELEEYTLKEWFF
jgi:hypothetical protein